MENLNQSLALAAVFSKMTPRQRGDLAASAATRRFARDEVVFWQGDIWTRVAYVASGRLEWIMLSPEGRRQVIFELNPGDVLWGHSFVDDLPMPASLEVREEAVLYLWERGQVLPILFQNAEAAWDVSRVLVAYMRRVRAVIYGFAFHPVAGRLARLLLSRYPEGDERPAPRDLTLDQMAETVGTTRELISRTLHRFADDGLIRVNRMEFAFTDRSRLEELARQD